MTRTTGKAAYYGQGRFGPGSDGKILPKEHLPGINYLLCRFPPTLPRRPLSLFELPLLCEALPALDRPKLFSDLQDDPAVRHEQRVPWGGQRPIIDRDDLSAVL